jgi:GntR family transcriptional repressor for pyruvate dehydrogenase complex
MIKNGQLKPGDRLPTEGELCQQFKVSRTTLREAIQMLRVGGLLKVSPGRGSFVQQPNLDKILDDLALYSRSLSRVDGDVGQVLLALLNHTVPSIVKRTLEERRDLFNHVLERNHTAGQAEEVERNWLLALMRLSNNQVAEMVAQILLATHQEERIQRFSDPDEVMRSIQTQIRLNTAVVEGERDVACRVLQSYLVGVSPLEAALNEGTRP